MLKRIKTMIRALLIKILEKSLKGKEETREDIIIECSNRGRNDPIDSVENSDISDRKIDVVHTEPRVTFSDQVNQNYDSVAPVSMADAIDDLDDDCLRVSNIATENARNLSDAMGLLLDVQCMREEHI